MLEPEQRTVSSLGIVVFLVSARDYICQATFGGSPMSLETVATLNANIHRGLLVVDQDR